MIWKTKTHEFTATICQRTGKTCPALARMARVIAQAMETAAPATTPGFQVEGSSELTHCARGCTARFRAETDQVRVFCGGNRDAPLDTLDYYADMMFGTAPKSLPADRLSDQPCAMLEVRKLQQQPALHVSEQMTL